MPAPSSTIVEPLFPEAVAGRAPFGGKGTALLSLLIGFGVGIGFMSQAPVFRSGGEVELFAAPAARQVSMPRVGSLALAQPRISASLRTPGLFGGQIGERSNSLDPLVPSAVRVGGMGAKVFGATLTAEKPKPVASPEVQALLEMEGYNGHKKLFDAKRTTTLQIAYRLWVERHRAELKEEYLNLPPKEAKKHHKKGTKFFLGNPWLSHKFKALDREEKEPYMKTAAAMKAIEGGNTAEQYLMQYGYGNFTTADLKAAGMKARKWSVSKIEAKRAREALEASWKARRQQKSGPAYR